VHPTTTGSLYQCRDHLMLGKHIHWEWEDPAAAPATFLMQAWGYNVPVRPGMTCLWLMARM
jgi:hypothetical protein